MNPEIGQTVRVYKAGEPEPYAAIVVSLQFGNPTLAIFPKFQHLMFGGKQLIILDAVPRKTADWPNGWEPINGT